MKAAVIRKQLERINAELHPLHREGLIELRTRLMAELYRVTVGGRAAAETKRQAKATQAPYGPDRDSGGRFM